MMKNNQSQSKGDRIELEVINYLVERLHHYALRVAKYEAKYGKLDE